MITDSYSTMMTDVGMRAVLQRNDYGEELGLLLREQLRQDVGDRERELSLYRSGSAPPTVEGSLSAVGGLFGYGGGAADFGGFSDEEELRSDPAYISYYYSNVNLNPRLPPPLLSKEDWRFAQRLQSTAGGSLGLGGIGDRRKAASRGGDYGGNDRSLFSRQPGINGMNKENGAQSRKQLGGAEWGRGGLIGFPGLGMGSRQKSIAEAIQDDTSHAASGSRHPSRPASRNAFDDVESSGSHFGHLHHELASGDALRYTNVQDMPAVQTKGASASHTYASVLGASLSGSTTTDPHLVSRALSPRIPTVGGGRDCTMDKRKVNDSISSSAVLSGLAEPADLVTALSNMTLSTHSVDENHSQSLTEQEIDEHQNFFRLQANQNPIKLQVRNSGGNSLSNYHNLDSPSSSLSNYGFTGYVVNPESPSMMANQSVILPPLFENIVTASALDASGVDSRTFGAGLPLGRNLMAAGAELQNHVSGGTLQMSLMDPLYLQYLRMTEYAAAQTAASNDLMVNSEGIGNSYIDVLGLQKAYLGGLLSPQKSQYGPPCLDESGSLNNNYYENSIFGVGMSYPVNPVGGLILPNSSMCTSSAVRHGARSMRFPSGLQNLPGGAMGTWHPDTGCHLDKHFALSLLDEFKSNKTKCFELSEIAGHVVEFSSDQYGSRFIQQKLETATSEEKNMVFHEIMPRTLPLMTDVFGNYVIQKFFEHGTASQIRELANQLNRHVLTLSLQMYGCRVIQKAIEVVDLDQQTKMVSELDGHVMRCVRDQNGNHVIQKCIECIPEGAIPSIISVFYDQVVGLSTHPYGCRVIQRVLEHCSDPKTLHIVMDEILQSVRMLAQDQYGNYVIQHVLQHGKPHERSSIINQLMGQIVHLSQQKFASNVVEKCLTFGTPAERHILVNEMLGSNEVNEPLQVMMKDQFANYVVQKVLETCDDKQLELILNRIKVHLNALKKYTYGKHIVARVEKLVAAGERRIGALSSNPP